MTAESLRRAGNPAAAVDLCRDALIRFPGHLSARVTLGWALLDLGKLSEAQQEFETVRRQAPDNLAAIRGLAKLHTLHDSDGFQDADEDTFDPLVEPAPEPALPPAPVMWSPLQESLDPPWDPLEPKESTEPIDVSGLFEPVEPAGPGGPVGPVEPVVLRLERWLERAEARRPEGLTECA